MEKNDEDKDEVLKEQVARRAKELTSNLLAVCINWKVKVLEQKKEEKKRDSLVKHQTRLVKGFGENIFQLRWVGYPSTVVFFFFFFFVPSALLQTAALFAVR